MAVDDKVVHDECQFAVDSYLQGYRTIRLAKALGQLIQKRRQFPDNESLAAADHYLNMRMMTSASPPLFPMGMVLIAGYDLLKKSLLLLPDEIAEMFQETQAPLTKPTPRGREWAFRGLKDGVSVDYPGMFRGGVLRIPFEP